MNEKQKHIVGELLKELHIDKAVESLMKNQTDHIAALTAENAKLREALNDILDAPDYMTGEIAREALKATK